MNADELKIDPDSIKGILFLIVGPSGSGKSTLIEGVLKQKRDLVFPISATTRDPRPGEIEGKDYFYLSKLEFENKIKNNKFLEYASVHGETYYGTLLSEVIVPLQNGKDVIRHIDYQGVTSIRDLLPAENVQVVYIDAGPWDVLLSRINSRGEMSQAEIAARQQSFKIEHDFKIKADFIINNHDGKIGEAKSQLLSIIDGFDTLYN